jgi:hypothetical protein
MDTNLIFAIIAMTAFLGVAFYAINSLDDKPSKKKA